MRDALAAALKAPWSERVLDHATVIEAAARERLAQLPEKCPDDRHVGYNGEYVVCPTCHGSGKVYPAELVERIAAAIHSKDDGSYVSDWDRLADWRKAEYRQWAVAVLDALNGVTP